MSKWVLVCLVFAVCPSGLLAQRTAAPSHAIDKLASFDGVWRGKATLTGPGGKVRTIIQTERVGTSLGGELRIIEGRSYSEDGADAGLNAVGIVSQTESGGFEFRAYAQGHAGTFPMTISAGRFEWSMPAGPDSTIRYMATSADGKWHEEGWYERGGVRLAKVFEMNLQRLGATDWPNDKPVGPK